MNKSELARRVARRAPTLYQWQVEKLVNAILNEFVTALVRGDRVELRGFGTFSVRHRRARVGLNPRTGAHVAVDRKTLAVFKMGKEMHERLNRDQLDDKGYSSVRMNPQRARLRRVQSAPPCIKDADTRDGVER